MFKDLPEGTTHYVGDGCKPEHHPLTMEHKEETKCEHEGTFGEIDGIQKCVYCGKLLKPPYKIGDEINHQPSKPKYNLPELALWKEAYGKLTAKPREKWEEDLRDLLTAPNDAKHWYDYQHRIFSFIHSLLEAERAKLIDTIQAKLDRNDNPVLTPGLKYALTVLKHEK